jgi:hypothetical protein
MKKIFILGSMMAMSLTLLQSIYAQAVTTAVPFLLIAPNSRASGMGEGGAAIADDATAIHWNPAGLGFQTGGEMSITHANWLPQFGLSDLFYDYLNFKQDLPDYGGTLGGSVTYLNLGEFIRTDETGLEIGKFKGFEFAVAVGFGTLITEDLSIGTNLRFINSSLSDIATGKEKGSGIANTFSFDLGLLYKPKSLPIPFIDEDLGGLFNIGFNLSNIGPKVTYIDAAQADPLPTLFRLGIAIIPMKDEYNSLTISADFSKLLVYRDSSGSHELPKSMWTSFTKYSLDENLKLINSSIGLEYWYDKKVALRWGYFFEDPNRGNRNFMTFGAGLRYDIYGLDFSYISAAEDHPLSDTLRFTLLIIWGGLL